MDQVFSIIRIALIGLAAAVIIGVIVYNICVSHIKQQLAEKARIARLRAEQEEIERLQRERVKQMQVRLLKQAAIIDSLPSTKIGGAALAQPLDVELMKEMPLKNISYDMTHFNLGRFVAIDIETTGLDAQSKEIIEISAIKFLDFLPIERFYTLVRPKEPIPPHVTEASHITNEMVENASDIESAIPALIDFAFGYDIVSHSVTFDLKFLYKFGFDFYKWNPDLYDTLHLSEKHFGRSSGHSLPFLRKYLEIFELYEGKGLSNCLLKALIFINAVKNVNTHVRASIDIEGVHFALRLPEPELNDSEDQKVRAIAS